MLGMPLDAAEIVRLLQALELTVVADGEGQWSVGVPSHRFDISLEVDLIEELARLYGYNRLPVRYPQARLAPNNKPEARAALPLLAPAGRPRLPGSDHLQLHRSGPVRTVRSGHPAADPGQPISADMAAMRSSLWPGLVKALQHNLNRQQSRVRLFESGLRFVGQLEGLKQEAMLAGAICGKRLPEGWANGRDGVDFFDAKADVEAVLASAGAPATSVSCPVSTRRCTGADRAHRAGRAAGRLSGALHPELAKKLDLEQPVFLFELLLAEVVDGHLPKFRELSRFPEVRRDLALLVDQNVPAQDILTQIRAAAGEWLTDLRLFDVSR